MYNFTFQKAILKTLLPPPPSADDETIAAPPTVDRLATTATFEKITPEVAAAIGDTMGKEIPIQVEMANDYPVSNIDTIPQQQEAIEIVSPVDGVIMATIDKILGSIVNETLVELANDNTTSNVDTTPQQQEPTMVVSPVDAIVVPAIDKIVDSVVNEIPISVEPAENLPQPPPQENDS